MLTRNGWMFAGLAAVLLGLSIWLSYREVLIIAIAMLLCLALAVAWLWLRPEVDVHRQVVPSRVREGEVASGVVAVTNVGPRPSPPMAAMEHIGRKTIFLSLPAMEAGGTHTTTYPLPTERRGCYTVGPLTISHSDPLGLVTSGHADTAAVTLWVHPHLYKVEPIPTGHAQEFEGPTSAGAPRGGIAFHSLREYEPGDNLRLVHWRSTARTGKLMVRHTVITNQPSLLIVLDTSAASYDGDSFEDAVRIAASLAVAGADKRFPVTLHTTDGSTARIDPNGRGRTDLLDTLSLVQPSHDDQGLRAVLRLSTRREHGVSLGVVTGQPSRDQVDAVGSVRGRYEMVTMVRVGERFGRSSIGVPGVFAVTCETSDDFVLAWKAQVR